MMLLMWTAIICFASGIILGFSIATYRAMPHKHVHNWKATSWGAYKYTLLGGEITKITMVCRDCGNVDHYEIDGLVSEGTVNMIVETRGWQ